MNSSLIIEGISAVTDNLAETAINIQQASGIWIFVLFLFAFIGFTSLAYSVFNNMWKGMRLFTYGVLFIPGAFIVSMVNKKKRRARLKEWGELKSSLTGKNKTKFWVWLALRIFGLILVAMVMLSFLA